MSEAHVFVYGPSKCGDCDRVKRYLKRRNVDFRFLNVEENSVARLEIEAMIELDKIQETPRVLIGRGEGRDARVVGMLINPGDRPLELELFRHRLVAGLFE